MHCFIAAAERELPQLWHKPLSKQNACRKHSRTEVLEHRSASLNVPTASPRLHWLFHI